MPDPRTEQVVSLMNDFAERTGLSSGRPAQRYLWTDAFAVCNFLGLARLTGEPHYTDLALKLVDQVHHTLGKHRQDDSRSGWISGLDERDGEIHPTLGGLRIGKDLPERGPDESYDERLEWDRDGQYFHYLTKWMQALDQVSRSTGQPRFNLWARELAKTSHKAFTYQPDTGGSRRMYWKMSIDLTRALVPSMGQHDPLDGFVTYLQLRSTMTKIPNSNNNPDLANEIRQLEPMLKEDEWATADPLGIGGLLTDAYRVEQLRHQGVLMDENLLENLLSASLTGLQYYARSGELRLSAEYRLAFRELGLAIGLHAVQHMWQAASGETLRSSISPEVHTLLKAIMQYKTLGDQIESFWRDPAHHRSGTWSEHLDINEVMLATSLVPDGFLVLISH